MIEIFHVRWIDIYPWFALAWFTRRTDHRSPIWWSRHFRAFIYIPDLYDRAHDAGWKPYSLHDLGRVSCVGYVRCISRTIYHNGKLGYWSSIVDTMICPTRKKSFLTAAWQTNNIMWVCMSVHIAKSGGDKYVGRSCDRVALCHLLYYWQSSTPKIRPPALCRQ